MPFKVTDNETGRVVTFENKPSEQDLLEAFGVSGSEASQAEGSAAFINQALAGTLGAPVDIATAGLNLIPGVDIQDPIGGSESITRGLQSLGISTAEQGQAPQTFGEFLGQGVGEAVSMFLPFLGAAKKMRGLQKVKTAEGIVTTTAPTRPTIVNRVADQIINTAEKSPILASVSEITAGTGIGATRAVAEDQNLSPGARLALETAGGFAGGLAPTLAVNAPQRLALRAGNNLIKKLSLPFTEKGSKFRAGQLIKSKVADPDATISALDSDIISDLPPAVKTAEKRIIGIMTSLRQLDPVADKKLIEKLSKEMVGLEKQLRSSGFTSPEIMREVTAKRLQALEVSMTERMVNATRRANEKLSKLNPATRRSKESIIVRNELNNARKASYGEVEDLWNGLDFDQKVDFAKTREAYQRILSGTSQAEMGDIPIQLKSNRIARKKVDSTETTLLEMNGLRKKMNEVARIARAEGKGNKARIASKMEKAILDDLDDQGLGDDLKGAILATRSHKDKFEKGVVGKILGFSREGGAQIDPSLALEISIGRGGLKGAVDLDKVMITPEAKAATSRFLQRAFSRSTIDPNTGEFKPRQAAQFLSDNDEILDKFPELKALMSDALEAQNLAVRTTESMNQRLQNIRNPKISAAAEFLGADPGMEAASILEKRNSTKVARQLVRQANKDASGEALDGLRGGFVEEALKVSSTNTGFDGAGEQIVSGDKLKVFLNKNHRVLREVFDGKQLAKIHRIANELSLIDKARTSAGEPIDLESVDFTAGILKTLSRVGGARLGGVVNLISKKMGLPSGGEIQTSSILSERFKNFASHLTKDRAFQMIVDAVLSDDPKLLRALLMPLEKPTVKDPKRIFEVQRTINAWLLGEGQRVARDIEAEMEEDRQHGM